MKIFKTAIMAIAMVAFGASSCSAADNGSQSAQSTQSKEGKVIVVNDDTAFRPSKLGNKPMVIDFNATWCGPCRMMKPVFDKASAEFTGIKFYSVDTDNNRETASAFDIQGIPTLVLYNPSTGLTKTIVGIGDFFEGLDENSDPSREEVEEIMYNNFAKILTEFFK